MVVCKKILLIYLFFLLTLFGHASYVSAQERLAECDQCGYCQSRPAPGDWRKCVSCLYPAVFVENPNAVPASNKTLEVKYPYTDPPANETEKYEQGMRVTPYPGRYYTQIGCMDTTLSSFTDPQAAGGMLNFLLNKLIFPVVGVLSFLSLIYGAFLLMTAQGSEEQISRGKRVIMSALIGLIFVLGALLLIRIIGGNVLKMPWFSNKNEFTVTPLPATGATPTPSTPVVAPTNPPWAVVPTNTPTPKPPTSTPTKTPTPRPPTPTSTPTKTPTPKPPTSTPTKTPTSRPPAPTSTRVPTATPTKIQPQPINGFLPWNFNGPTSAWNDDASKVMAACNTQYCWLYNYSTSQWVSYYWPTNKWSNDGIGQDISARWHGIQPAPDGTLPWSNKGPRSAFKSPASNRSIVANGKYYWIYNLDANPHIWDNDGKPYLFSTNAFYQGSKAALDGLRLWEGTGMTSAWEWPSQNSSQCRGKYCWLTKIQTGYEWMLSGQPVDISSPSSTEWVGVEAYAGAYPWNDGGPDAGWTNPLTNTTYVFNNSICWELSRSTMVWKAPRPVSQCF